VGAVGSEDLGEATTRQEASMTLDGAGADAIRARVEQEYASKVQGAGCGRATPKEGDAAYGLGDTAAVPAEAVEASFGCGNPLAFAGVAEGDTVVDLGSGAGMDLLLAAKRAGATGKVIGIDMTDAMIERARANVARAGASTVEVRKGIIEALPVESASVDWVISNCVVNLSPEKPRVFAEIARVLAPGGRMLISDIVISEVPSWARHVVRRFNPAVAAAIGEAEYLAGLRRAGLGEVEVRARHVYDRGSLEGMLLSEIDGALDARGLRGAPRRVLRRALEAVVSRLARAADGKVTSVQVFARKGSAPRAPSDGVQLSPGDAPPAGGDRTPRR
jgi:SAM-dependent methyltransferase